MTDTTEARRLADALAADACCEEQMNGYVGGAMRDVAAMTERAQQEGR